MKAPPESPWKSRSTASTYALTDCCVGISVALSDAMLSSSTNAVAVIVPSESEPKVAVPEVVIFVDVNVSVVVLNFIAVSALIAWLPELLPASKKK